MRTPYLFALGIILFSCKKQPVKAVHSVQLCNELTSNIDTVQRSIQGNWNWVEERRINRYSQTIDYLTPITEGYTKTLRLAGNTAIFFRNNFIDEIYSYKIAKESDLFPGSSDQTIFEFIDLHTGNMTNFIPVYICSEYLVLDYSYSSDISGREIFRRIY